MNRSIQNQKIDKIKLVDGKDNLMILNIGILAYSLSLPSCNTIYNENLSLNRNKNKYNSQIKLIYEMNKINETNRKI